MLLAIDIDGTIARTTQHSRALLRRLPDNHPDVLSALDPISGAREALNSCAPHCQLVYVTCRPQATRDITQCWLERCGFPNADQVYPCKHYRYKYYKAFELAQDDDPVIVIDDLLKEMIYGFRQIVRDDRPAALSMYRRLTLAGYGHATIPDFGVKIPFPVRALPSWNEYQSLTKASTRVAMVTQDQF